MRRRDALRLFLRVVRRSPAPDRLHALIRYVTCPFRRMLAPLPERGRVLEIGAGHGLYSYFAASHGALEVTAVEPDVRKAVQPHEPGVRWINGFDDCVRGTFDCVLIADVLYLLPMDARVALCRRVFERLAAGGTFVLKELDPERPLKIRWARFQEALNNLLLHVTLGRGFVYQTRAEVESTLRAIGFEDIAAHAIDRGYPHPHILYVARKPL
ncbi:MAG TPA: class I SAM-dependent methyltransferase [Thermoanaerobaculia bacterium]|jgi:phospholipid N-methyltransferase